MPAKKILDHADFDLWKTIEKPILSDNGRWACYELRMLEGDPELVLFDGMHSKELRFARAQDAAFSADSHFLVFRIKPATDTLRALRRKKVKREELPKDTLAIFGQLRRHTNTHLRPAAQYAGGAIQLASICPVWKEAQTQIWQLACNRLLHPGKPSIIGLVEQIVVGCARLASIFALGGGLVQFFELKRIRNG